jgi:pimeloyl-ACP methyl ester carboxylesterase
MSSTIIVLVPGTTGSTLVGPNQVYDSLVPVWRYDIGLELNNVLPREPEALAALERTDLRPGVLVGMATRKLGYYPFAQYFASLGFSVANAQYAGPGTPVQGWGLPTAMPLPENLLVSFPYDWRQDCTASATVLQQLLATIDGLYAPAGYQLFLAGHSMGGLVCRAYLENVGQADTWRSSIRGLVTLGTPHLGAPLALAAIMGQIEIPPPPHLSGPALDTLIHNFVDTSFSDSTYELLPPPALESASQPPSTQYIQYGSEWYNLLDAGLPPEIATAVTTAASQSLPAGTASRYAEDLQSAATFFQTLNYTGTVSGSTPKLPPYYCVVGQSSANPTVTSFLYQSETQSLQPQAGTDGDEIVPQWSAAFTGRTVPVAGTYAATGVNHFSLPADPGVQAQVAAWIGVEQQQARAVREPAVV